MEFLGRLLDSKAGTSGCLPGFPLSLFFTHTCSFCGSCLSQTFFLFLSLSLSPSRPPPPLPEEGKTSDSHKQNICHSMCGRTEAGAQHPREDAPARAEGLGCFIWKAPFDVAVLRLCWDAACSFMAGCSLSPPRAAGRAPSGRRKSRLRPLRLPGEATASAKPRWGGGPFPNKRAQRHK